MINHVQVDQAGAWILSKHDVEALCIGELPATSIMVIPHCAVFKTEGSAVIGPQNTYCSTGPWVRISRVKVVSCCHESSAEALLGPRDLAGHNLLAPCYSSTSMALILSDLSMAHAQAVESWAQEVVVIPTSADSKS